MRKFLIFFAIVSSISLSSFAYENDHFSPHNYLYNASGEPAFLKLYLPSKNSHFLSRTQIPLAYPIQNDKHGEFILIKIQDNYWVCPLCGTTNPDSSSDCQNKKCPLSW